MPHWIIGVEREGDISLKIDDQQGLVLDFTEHYIVVSDAPENNMWLVMRDAIPTEAARPYLPVNGLPLPGFTTSLDGNCVCESLNGQREAGNPRKWRFTARFSSRVEQGRSIPNTNGQPPSQPEQDIPVRETMFEVVRRNRFEDYIGLKHTNGAGLLFNSPIETEDVLSRWEFSQYEPVYTGNFGGGVQNRIHHTVHNFAINPPGVYASSAPNAPLIGVTDATINYFNGCLNHVAFRGMEAFTLRIQVRKSVIGYYYGALRRLSEYSIIYDPQNWLTKVANAGPYFIGPKIDSNGNVAQNYLDDLNNQQLYPYIYFSKSKEDADSDLSIDQNGPLGGAATFLFAGILWGVQLIGDPASGPNNPKFLGTQGKPWPPAAPYVFIDGGTHAKLFEPEFYRYFMGRPGLDDPVLVETSSNNKTFRAVKPPAQKDFSYNEYLNNYLIDFNRFFRVP